MPDLTHPHFHCATRRPPSFNACLATSTFPLCYQEANIIQCLPCHIHISTVLPGGHHHSMPALPHPHFHCATRRPTSFNACLATSTFPLCYQEATIIQC